MAGTKAPTEAQSAGRIWGHGMGHSGHGDSPLPPCRGTSFPEQLGAEHYWGWHAIEMPGSLMYMMDSGKITKSKRDFQFLPVDSGMDQFMGQVRDHPENHWFKQQNSLDGA